MTTPACVGCIVATGLKSSPYAALMFGVLMGAEVKSGELIMAGACKEHQNEIARGLMLAGTALVDLHEAIDAEKKL